MKLEEILRTLDDATIPSTFNGFSSSEIRGLVYDSRQVQPGDLFVAVRGHRADGHRYLSEAVRRGAIAAVVEEADSPASGSIPLILVSDSRRALALLANRFYGH